jgi:hypothetical protein
MKSQAPLKANARRLSIELSGRSVSAQA